jgi:hypothetical protein
VENGNLYQPYEILNETGLSALTWESEGVYVFRATVIDPEYRLVLACFLFDGMSMTDQNDETNYP